ncbi:hypothetical protein KBD69_01945 [Candidatus Woesebacteria bacterium]|nr:hypothetical protein [Candidatus Woesebacteria bacterium]
MISWSQDKDRRIYPVHYRRAVNFSGALVLLCDQYAHRLTEYSVSDLLNDRIHTLEQFLDKKKKPKIVYRTDQLDIETSTQTIISLLAVSPMINTLLLLAQDADALSQRFECTTINEPDNRIFGRSLGANQFTSEYIFKD